MPYSGGAVATASAGLGITFDKMPVATQYSTTSASRNYRSTSTPIPRYCNYSSGSYSRSTRTSDNYVTEYSLKYSSPSTRTSSYSRTTSSLSEDSPVSNYTSSYLKFDRNDTTRNITSTAKSRADSLTTGISTRRYGSSLSTAEIINKYSVSSNLDSKLSTRSYGQTKDNDSSSPSTSVRRRSTLSGDSGGKSDGITPLTISSRTPTRSVLGETSSSLERRGWSGSSSPSKSVLKVINPLVTNSNTSNNNHSEFSDYDIDNLKLDDKNGNGGKTDLQVSLKFDEINSSCVRPTGKNQEFSADRGSTGYGGGAVAAEKNLDLPSSTLPASALSSSLSSSSSSDEEDVSEKAKSNADVPNLSDKVIIVQEIGSESGVQKHSGWNEDSAGSSRRMRAPFKETTKSTYSMTVDGGGFDSSPQLARRGRSNNSGLIGLRNIGNTCFMNSVIQCLSNTKPLLEYVLTEKYLMEINTKISSMKGALMKAFSAVIQELWSEIDDVRVVNTTTLKSQIQKFAPRFMGYNQQDAQEFLRYLLEGLHEDINRVTIKPKPNLKDISDELSDQEKAAEAWKRYLSIDNSKIVDIFVGQLKSTLKCTTCGHCSVTFDPFWDLSLPIPSRTGQLKLQQCLEHFTKEEILDGDEKPTCSKCQTRRKCTKSFTIQKFPRVLVLHLKRFSPTERYRGKLNVSVDFPINGLDMSAYAAGRGQGCLYNLYGVANHSGTTHSGHYTAYCKHPNSSEWHEYNDSRVSVISSRSVVSSEAYLLFYELSGQTSHL